MTRARLGVWMVMVVELCDGWSEEMVVMSQFDMVSRRGSV